MPLGIGDAYEREVEKIIKNPRIEERNEAIMILRWVLFAVRPLQVKQLAEALIVSDDKVSERYPEEYLPDNWKESFVDEDYVQEIILRPCGSLLQLRSGKEDEILANKTVHFVHFSVKEYLSSLTNESVLGRALGLLDTRTEELRLARICLRYLTLNVFEEMSASSDNTTYPFLEYAAWAWFFHGFDRNFAPPNKFGHLTKRVFKPSSSSWRICGTFLENEFDDSAESKSAQENLHFEDHPGESGAGSTEDSWIDDETIDDGSTGDLSVSQSSFHEVQNPAYYPSLLGLQDVITWLEEQGIDCSCEGGRFGYPLQAAVVRKQKELIIHFLSRGIDPSQKGGLYACAIIAAAAVSTSEILNILLDKGANVMAKDAQGWTALHHAARRGNVDIVHILINHPECDKDAVTTGNTPKTALSLACEYGNEDVAFALLNQGATGLQTALPQNGDMPLHYAITYGHHKLACRLLDAGALFETKTRTGMTPLLIAIIENAPKVVKKLLEKNARVDLIYEDWTMLQYASSGADPEIVKLLIASGADVNQCRGNIQSEASSLLIATSRNRTDVISILLEHGAATERAAYFAVLYGHESAMSLLMKRDNISQDLVRRGSFRKSLRTTEEYLKSIEKGCDHDLAILTFLGDARKVESLFKEPVFISQDDLNEAFHIAAARGFLDILKMFIQKGAFVNSRELTRRTALHAAAFHNYEEITEALVVNGASWFLEDSIGSTPIDLAVRHGQKALNLVQRYISDYSFVIRKRPSLLEDTSRNESAATAQKIRKALSGRWEGSYEYLSWFKGRIDEFAIEISEPELVLASSTTFEEENYDIAGAFKIMGFVDEKGIVWFVKLYERHGWLYRGQLDESLKTFKGTWSKNRNLWQGTFVLHLVS
ncbi:hypothetical protein BELL_1172g00010 [Botrytis elliptica]|uniref:GPI inositol-deacylase winged helix domain-containing protein n=1 Tax=Botrytis elliptica TaxID=278938 RepID=A0A4Z1IKT4_9HELO|nr:hypothetical protein BELL_1172g00010 [Botrytis elliptica]